MGRVRSSKSYDADANNSHRRTVSSLNIARTEESRSNKSSSIASRSSASRSAELLNNELRSGVARGAKSNIGKSNIKKSSIKKTRDEKIHISKPRSASSLRKDQRFQRHIISQNTSQIRVADINEKNHQGKFVDARLLPKLDFVRKTLSQTSGSLGMITRPRIINFRERLKERKSAYLQFTVKRILAILAVIASVSAIVWFLFFSPVFLLKSNDISISGSNEWVSEQKIASIASTQVGKSLFLVSSQEVINQLNDIPGVTEAKVSKNFPNGLHVSVHAQRPAAMLKTRDSNKLTAVDAKGRVLNAVAQVPTQGIPVIEVSNVQRSLNNRAVLEAVKIVSSLSESLRARVTKVSAKTQDSVETELGDVKKTIIWGNSSQIELKKAIVAKIIDDPSKIGNKRSLDVSAPVRPILK
ncbi:cell division protein FtsQ/DivIB [Gardnerella swidsinskii]|jgi:cell division septal protein|uniref:cell division protein FtsQ/DivIB n=1 Tax=Gardnerella TaxID=2701 RepID=UPI0001D85518|nr:MULTISPECIES: FtsQ-type POTRA domain-containing protein [Gardnerella]EFH71874.1 cell division septal protein [Gardnerella vaginalis 5-1]NSX39182.1 FtsQ-type POTRA domain-containing protein [Gardnerella vaginalis]RFT35767.1 cell division protein FtsQ [Bifidobacteriaceae bacterium NR020]RIY30289.1 cell division protein FtsQ [Bifidobacteriaceae bacterium NR016]PMC44170.1 cell division protein FtsQ [Gardnerella vaginalis]